MLPVMLLAQRQMKTYIIEASQNMSYIHRYNDNYYKPSGNLTNLFKEKVIQPFERDLPTLAENVKNKKLYYWKDIACILEQ